MSDMNWASTKQQIALRSGIDHTACELALRQGKFLTSKQFGIAVLPETNADAPGGRWS
jgi:hypothetical protein